MRKFIVLMMALFVLLAGALTASAQTCAISSGIGKGLIADTDCDRIPDLEDNCPFIVNPAQRDAESNGLGDACDLYIKSISTSPSDFVYDGRAFNTIVTLENNRDYNIRNLKVRVFIPELRIESVQYVDNLEVCSAETLEFFLRAPMCVPKHDYKILVEASFMNMFGETESILGLTSIMVLPGQYCQMLMENNQTIGNTFIDVMEIQDVYKGSEAVFPITISNMEENDKDYTFTVTGLDGWGYFRLEPGSLIIVPNQAQRTMDLYIGAYNNVAPGERVFVVSIQSGEEVQRFLLIANVKESGQVDNTFLWMFSLRVLLIGGLVLLIIIALIVGLKKYVGNAKSESSVQYY
jgi:Thrombospondin type 3 repeat